MYLCAPGYVDKFVADAQTLRFGYDVSMHHLDVSVIGVRLEVRVRSRALREGPSTFFTWNATGGKSS